MNATLILIHDWTASSKFKNKQHLLLLWHDYIVYIVKGTVVRIKLLHLWAEEGHFEDSAYNGYIEKLKGKNYTVCCWGLGQTFEENGEDYKVLLHELAVDFICGDIEFLGYTSTVNRLVHSCYLVSLKSYVSFQCSPHIFLC